MDNPTVTDLETEACAAFDVERIRWQARGEHLPQSALRVFCAGWSRGADWGLEFAKRVYSDE